jgi:hypothetical protein
VRRIARRALPTALVVALFVVAGLAAGARAEGAGGSAPPGTLQITGSWTGAKLRCQKEEGKLLRCGTPMPCTITFAEGGTGATPDDSLPREFTWRWLAANEIGVTAAGGGEEIKLFSVERDGDMLTFQAYIFLPTADPGATAEERYIHYIYDVSLDK